MSHYLIKKQLQNTDKKHIKKDERIFAYLRKWCNTQLADKGLNNDLYNYRGGVFPIGKIPPLFVQLLNI